MTRMCCESPYLQGRKNKQRREINVREAESRVRELRGYDPFNLSLFTVIMMEVVTLMRFLVSYQGTY